LGNRAAWLFAVLLLPMIAAAQIRIGVATVQPGQVFFERFGHNALVVDRPERADPITYNFGYFDPDEPGFLTHFIRGDMRYSVVALPLSTELHYYQQDRRGVSIQWLDLDDTAAAALAAALAENVRPEHAHYRYDYFTANCSTKVRDALDQALGGTLRQQLETRSRQRGGAVGLAGAVDVARL